MQSLFTLSRAGRFRWAVIGLLAASSGLMLPVPAGSSASQAPEPSSIVAKRVPTRGGCAPKPTSDRVVNVRDKGATADDSTDDTAAFKRGVRAVGGTGGTLLVPGGTYLIDAVRTWDGGKGGVALRNKMTLKLAPGAVLQAIANDKEGYSIVSIFDVKDVNVVGGVIAGERGDHQGSTGEWGNGIDIRGARRVAIDGVTTKENWGDGVYLDAGADDVRPTNIELCGVVSNHNRRQGLSIVGGHRVVVRRSVFKNTEGTAPQCGIDIEPDAGQSSVDDVKILNSHFPNNASCGIKLYPANPITNVLIKGNTVSGPASRGISIGGTDGQRVINNRIQSYYAIDLSHGFSVSPDAPTGNTVTGNQICAPMRIIRGVSPDFVLVESDFNGNTVHGNTAISDGC